MKRTLTLLSVFALLLSTMVLPAAADTPVYGPSGPTYNNASAWEAWGLSEFQEVWACEKIDLPSDDYTLDPPPTGYVWRLLVIKAGSGETENALFFDPVVGMSYTHPITNDVSHVIRCLMEAPVVLQGLLANKTAEASYTRTVAWDIEKSASPSQIGMFTGDEATTTWTVDVVRSEQESDFEVSGVITVSNPNPVPVDFSVVDVLDDNTVAEVDCDPNTEGAQPFGTAPAAVGETAGIASCDYVANPSGRTATLNTATVSADDLPDVTALAPVDWEENLIGFDEIDVEDTSARFWTTGESISWSYEERFTCDADEGELLNTAIIRQTGQDADATVTVDCYELAVVKDALTTLTRTWNWSIDKVGDQESLTLAEGQSFAVNYEVNVFAVATDSEHQVTGEIIVHNPAPIAATILNIEDVVSDDIFADVNCGVDFPYQLDPGQSLICDYLADLPDDNERVNIATVTRQNVSTDAVGVVTATGETEVVGTADVSFEEALVTEIDRCVEVDDDQYGLLGTSCAEMSPFDSSFDYTFEYTLQVGPYDECGLYEFVNIASFSTDDTHTVGSDTWTVGIDVPCPGCTLTQGYWKTHSEYGPAPYDDTWALLSDGADTDFFASGQSYYEVLWTPPAGGNPYYQLAHQYIAAELNLLNGASMDSNTTQAFHSATEWLENASPTQRLSRTEANMVRGWAEILDTWNNAFHCDEDGTSV